MKSMLRMDFSVNRENNTITVEREFAAKLPLVWDAFTKAEILDQWWAPKPWRARTKSMDFRVGGHWAYAMVSPNNEEHWGLSTYSEIDIHQQYAGNDAFTDAEGNVMEGMPKSNFAVNFASIPDKTLVTFVMIYGDLAQLEATVKMGFREGLTMTMEALDALLPVLAAQK